MPLVWEVAPVQRRMGSPRHGRHFVLCEERLWARVLLGVTQGDHAGHLLGRATPEKGQTTEATLRIQCGQTQQTLHATETDCLAREQSAPFGARGRQCCWHHTAFVGHQFEP